VEIKIIPSAAKKIKLRSITKDMLYETINHPDQTVAGYGGRVVKQKVCIINNKKKLLRVICEIENNDSIVISAYLTSQIKKYWRSK